MKIRVGASGDDHVVALDCNPSYAAHLIATTVDHIDTLLEDWYPTLGTRFVHTSEGKFSQSKVLNNRAYPE